LVGYTNPSSNTKECQQGISGIVTMGGPKPPFLVIVLRNANTKVEAIGELPLELNDGFVLKLTDVLYVPSLRRNLISVSRLDDDGYDCHFGNGKCQIEFNNKCVGLAFRQDKLYLLSVSENVNVVSNENENASSSMNARNKQKRVHDVSSKFLDLEQCIDCIKGKYVRNNSHRYLWSFSCENYG
jgi:hypothetical protein